MCYNYHTLHCCALLHSNADVCKHLDRNGNNVLWVHCTWMNCLCRLIQPPWRQEPGCSHRSRECQRNDGTEADLFLQACGGPPKCVLSSSRMGTWPPWTWMSLGSQVCNFVHIHCCPVEPNFKDEEKLSYKTDSTKTLCKAFTLACAFLWASISLLDSLCCSSPMCSRQGPGCFDKTHQVSFKLLIIWINYWIMQNMYHKYACTTRVFCPITHKILVVTRKYAAQADQEN